MSLLRLASIVLVLLVAAVVSAQTSDRRVAASTLRMPTEGNTLAWKSVPAFGGLAFEQPVQVVFNPSAPTRAYVVERGGRIAVVRDTANPTREVLLDLSPRIGVATDLALLSVAFHPRFAENGFFYAWFSTYVDNRRVNRLARFRVLPTNSALADPASETPLITQLNGVGGHDGGQILFGPDGYLYLSIGDGDRNTPEIDAAHQRIDAGFFGGVIRIDVDLRPGSLPPNPHASVHPGTYTVPADNPFVGATSFNGLPVVASAVRTEWWAVGLRNPWRMAFDVDEKLWLADVGLETREEINLITRGANYGWEFREGFVPGPKPGLPPAGAQFTDPIWDYPRSEGFSVAGGFVYRGTLLTDLIGQYIFADFVSGRIWALIDNGSRPVPASQVRLIAVEPGITGIAYDPRTGDVLLADFDSNQIKRLTPNPNASGTPLPATLGATGVFANVASLTPAPGVLPYSVNAAFWSDHATKTRWFALPDLTSTFGFSAETAWTLPAGAVWAQHFNLELHRGLAGTARRIETRILVSTTNGVYGATYRWNEAQTDATLVPDEGATQTFTVTESDGTSRPQTWIFPGRSHCVTCHTERGGGALAFNTRQLNRALPGGTRNQITELADLGYFHVPVAPPASTLPALPDPSDQTIALERRARAYLDVNCSQCHQPGSTALGAFDARAATPLSLAGIVNGPIYATVGDTANRVIAPGDTVHSVMLRRMTGDGFSRMPPVGSSERDRAGESLISQWIIALGQPQPPSRLLNLAARAQVGIGGDILIPGFFVSGLAPKSILIRAIGPSLELFGIGGVLSAPVLTLFNERQQAVATNIRWGSAANADAVQAAAIRVGAFPLPRNSADSALLITLQPGAYTAQSAGIDGGTGVALVEIYDADEASSVSSPRLINTAVRAQVGTGSNLLIPGLVVSAGSQKQVLIRAVGPGLESFGVSGTLAQPVMSLFSGGLSYVTNSGWNTAANSAEIRTAASRVGAFPLAEGSKDSAMLLNLSPGAYTVQVSGANETSGLALVEIYEVP